MDFADSPIIKNHMQKAYAANIVKVECNTQKISSLIFCVGVHSIIREPRLF